MKKSSKILSFILVFSFLLGAVPLGAIMPLAANSDVSADLILKENKEMRLWYDEPAPDDDNRTWDHNKAKNSSPPYLKNSILLPQSVVFNIFPNRRKQSSPPK